MKWLITGSEGQLGRSLTRLLHETRPSDQVRALSRRELDIRKVEYVAAALEEIGPDVVVNCAAWTQVDLAEEYEEEATAVNAHGPAHLAVTLARRGHGILVQVSTDYVFGGPAVGPHREDDPVDPQCVYARTKSEAEVSVREALPDRSLILRTAWLYSKYGSNFATTVIRRLMRDEPLRVVNDQLGQPTFALDVAGRIADLVSSPDTGFAPAGIYHATNAGAATRWQFAVEIARLMGEDPRSIEPISTAELHLPATRPSDSRLEDTAWQDLGIAPMRSWEEALAVALPGLLTA